METFEFVEVTDSLDHEDYNFKIVIIGDSGVGKTNILSRYTHNEFNQDSKATVGVELQSKVYKIDNRVIRIQLWDTAGQERYKSITAAYFKGAKGALIVYDITKTETFNNVDKWFNQIREYGDQSIEVIVAGNKCDLKNNRTVTTESATEKCRGLNIALFETSAADNTNVDLAFKTLISEIYGKLKKKISKYEIEEMTKGHSLQNNNINEEEKCKC